MSDRNWWLDLIASELHRLESLPDTQDNRGRLMALDGFRRAIFQSTGLQPFAIPLILAMHAKQWQSDKTADPQYLAGGLQTLLNLLAAKDQILAKGQSKIDDHETIR